MITTTRTKILSVAASQVGTKESPAGSNKQKYGLWYGMNGVAWCGIVISWLFDQAGFPLPKIDTAKGFHYCPSAVNYFRRLGWFTVLPTPGDIVFFDWDKDKLADHVGLFIKWIDADQFETFEGNTSVGNDSNGGEFMHRVRHRKDVLCFVDPHYPKD